jgi:hypothetical protein
MGNDILDDILTLSAVLPLMDKPTKSISDNLILPLRFTLLPFCLYIRERKLGYDFAPRRKFATCEPRCLP